MIKLCARLIALTAAAATAGCGSHTPTAPVARNLRRTDGAPTGALGFRFGISAIDAERVCRSGGREWRHDKPEGYFCFGDRNWGIAFDVGHVGIDTCGGVVCDVTLILPAPALPAEHYESVAAELARLYGSPHSGQRQFPDECTDVAAYMQCARDGRGDVSDFWQWRDETSLLALLKVLNDSWVVAVSYSSPLSAERNRSDGL